MIRVKQLVPYAVVFPYIRMGRSFSAFSVNKSQGKFGPFENQMFLGDYTLSILMRATTGKGQWYLAGSVLSIPRGPFDRHPQCRIHSGRETAMWRHQSRLARSRYQTIRLLRTPRMDWQDALRAKSNRITIEADGFKVTFTKPVDQSPAACQTPTRLRRFTHPYHAGYGGPEIEQHKPGVKAVSLCRRRTFGEDHFGKARPGICVRIRSTGTSTFARQGRTVASQRRSTPSTKFPPR